MDITHRNLQPSEAKYFSDQLRDTANITSYSPRELLGYEDAYVATDGGKPLGFLILKSIGSNWIEILALFVDKDFRALGISSKLITAAKTNLPKGISIMTVSRNPIIIRQLQKNGFSEVSFWRLPLEVKVSQLRFAFNGRRFAEYIRKNSFANQPPFRFFVKVG